MMAESSWGFNLRQKYEEEMADAKPYSDEEIKAKGAFWTGKASGLLSNYTIAFMTGKKVDDPDVEIDLSRIFATIADLKSKRTADAERFKGYIGEWGEKLRKAEKRIEELEKIVRDLPDHSDIDAHVFTIHDLERQVKTQVATIEQLEGERKERDELLNNVVKMDIDIQIKKTIADFYERQCQTFAKE